MTLDDRYVRLFDEAIAYLRQKISIATDKWDDVTDSEIDAAFTVAGAKGALLNDIRAAVESAIAEGKRIEDFRDEFDSIVERRGWSPRGGKDWRARLIYSQNLATSYAAGRYTYQLDPGVLEVQPYLQYIHGDSRAPRPAHLALDGKIFRANELPFYPPAGFGCSCRTISLSEKEVQGKEISEIKQGDVINYKDDREVTREAIIQPDKGFNFRPEMPSDQRRQDSIANILQRSSPAIRRAIEKELDSIVKAKTPAKPEWKPLMTEEEADAYTADSVWAGMTFYHGTSRIGAESIATDGVDVKKNRTGIYGQGFYASDDLGIATEYADLDQPAYVKAKLLARNPKIFDTIEEAIAYFRDNGLGQLSDAKKTRHFVDRGFDAVLVRSAKYFVVYQREQAAIFAKQDLEA